MGFRIIAILILLFFQNNLNAQESKKQEISINGIILLPLMTSDNFYRNDKLFGIKYKNEIKENFKLKIGFDIILKSDYAIDRNFISRQIDIATANLIPYQINFWNNPILIDQNDTSITLMYTSYYYDPIPMLLAGVEKSISFKKIKFNFGFDLLTGFTWSKYFDFYQTYNLDSSNISYGSYLEATTDMNMQKPIFTETQQEYSIGCSPSFSVEVPFNDRVGLNFGTHFYWMYSWVKRNSIYHQSNWSSNEKFRSSSWISPYWLNNLSVYYKF